MNRVSTPVGEFVSLTVRARTPDKARRIAAHEVRQEGRRVADVAQVTDQGDGRTYHPSLFPVRMVWRRATRGELKRERREGGDHYSRGGLAREWVPA